MPQRRMESSSDTPNKERKRRSSPSVPFHFLSLVFFKDFNNVAADVDIMRESGEDHNCIGRLICFWMFPKSEFLNKQNKDKCCFVKKTCWDLVILLFGNLQYVLVLCEG